MEKKLYTQKIVKQQSVSFIIGKNGCHIKDITNKIKNGAYIEYKPEGNKFIISAYSKESMNKLLEELDKLEAEFDTNRKKYVEYKFVNRIIDHGTITEIIQSLKKFNHSAFVEYKGDNIFVMSNYNLDCLNSMLEKMQSYDVVCITDPNTNIVVRKDFKKIMEEIEMMEQENEALYYNNSLMRNITTGFTLNDDQNIETNIDNYIDPSESIDEIELNEDDADYIIQCEKVFIQTCDKSNPFFQLSRDHYNKRRISDL